VVQAGDERHAVTFSHAAKKVPDEGEVQDASPETPRG
jgi:hypothetical protein